MEDWLKVHQSQILIQAMEQHEKSDQFVSIQE